MSYILDALKKAEAERSLGAVPNLHAQPFVAAPSADRSAWRTPWSWATLAILAAAGALALLQPWRAPVPPGASAPMPVAPNPPLPQVATAPAAPAHTAPPVAAKETPPPPPARVKSVKPALAEKKPAPQPVAKVVKESKPAADTPAANEPPVVTLRELPESIQREVPRLTTNGYIYSSNKADRTVLINQKLLHEGDQIAPDLTLEKLTPSGMVLNYKGYRYRTSY
ncbi:hypothetical protein D3870_13465 [Noviherbaspirillum cavernae]|uniref:Type II secretion system protein GspB C-terminal domain-containing protein n=1 Tax=Noviherbaspirillum cavernae TaxID=2320862 RepID=A0A418X331_9BURK|nr:general secretion pathway protein GspB [Noviherbaspirillum cavernae]RJG06872.1 hypothetical protein D3870_13465 [Noviherbaspirillum cavernae]